LFFNLAVMIEETLPGQPKRPENVCRRGQYKKPTVGS
jgi:hypothetical protein